MDSTTCQKGGAIQHQTLKESLTPVPVPVP